MLARRLTTILPAMTLAEAIETTRIPRVAGRLGDRTAVVTTRRDRRSLWSSMAMRTGNGSYEFAVRGGCSDDHAGVKFGSALIRRPLMAPGQTAATSTMSSS